jgi:hypothetical protein
MMSSGPKSPSSNHGVAGEEPFPDDVLVQRLDAALPSEIDGIIANELEISSAIARADLRPSAVRDAVMKRADEILRATNNEIISLRNAQNLLTQYEIQRYRTTRAATHRTVALRNVPYERIGLGLWLAIAFPITVWLAWPALSTALGGLWGTLVLIGVGVLMLPLGVGSATSGARRISRPPKPAEGDTKPVDPAEDAEVGISMTAVGISMGIGYALLVWRLWGGTVASIGSGWAQVLWISLGILVGAFSLLLLVTGLWMFGENIVAKGWLAVANFLLAAVLGLAAWLAAAAYVPHQYAAPIAGGSLALLVAVCLPTLLRWLRNAFGWLKRSLAALGAPLPGIPPPPGSRPWRRERDALAAAVARQEEVWRAAVRNTVLPILREQIQFMRTPAFTTVREDMDFSGLRQMRSVDHIIETRAFDRFRTLMATLSGGALGVAGPRGVGKSTLLEYYYSGRMAVAGTEHLAVSESVPVRYDARDYALHMYATLCESALKFRGTAQGHGIGAGARLYAGIRTVGTYLVVGLATIGVASLGAISVVGWHAVPQWLQRAVWIIPAAIVVLAVALFLAYRHPDLADRPVSLDDVRDLDTLKAHANQKLNGIRYQSRRTSGWSHTIGLPMGGGGMRSRSIELATLPMAYPDIANEFRAFLARIVETLRREPNISPVPVAIVLDELDKMSDAEKVQEFLNEVKGLFAIDVPGCLFLVSVSEDALAAFDRRGLPVRDAFDSTFDAILPVDYLDLNDATRLLRSRVVRLPMPFICLSYCLSGGLPRELVRYARETFNSPNRELSAICADLVGDELRRRARALETVMARNVNPEPFASDLLSYINSHVSPASGDLLRALTLPPITGADQLARDDWAGGYLIGLQAESMGHIYYYATILEVFDKLTENAFMSDQQQTSGSFEILASARRQFSLNARLAWLTISRFREQWGLTLVDPPPVVYMPDRPPTGQGRPRNDA